MVFFFSSRRRHTRSLCDWSSDVCSSDLWLSRYQTAMWRVRTVPLVIALAVASQSWVVALILVVAAPLIPLFMAIVGWRAKAASQAQMVELGGMNAFLLDRLRGLSTLRAL